MSNLTSEFLIQAIEKVRSGASPENVFSSNFMEITGEDVYNKKMVQAIEKIWIPIGDKAFIREGYHDAVTKIEHYFYPPPPKEEHPEFDINEFIF